MLTLSSCIIFYGCDHCLVPPSIHRPGIHSILTAVEVVRANVPTNLVGEIGRCFTSVNCDPATEFTFTTVEDCCFSERGLSYFISGTEECGVCVCKYQVLYFSIAS